MQLKEDYFNQTGMKTFFLTITLLFSISIFGQEIFVERTKKYEYNLNKNSIIIDNDNGIRIDFKDLGKLIEAYPNSTVVPKEEDRNGNPISYYFLKNADFKSDSDDSKKVEIKRKDIFGDIFDLQKVDNKKVLIIIQLDLEFPMINVDRIKEVESSALKRDDCISVILTTSDYNQAKKFTEEQGFKSIIIPNSQSIIDKFQFKKFPMYIIFNKDKSIHSSLKYHYEVEEEFLKLD